MNDTTNLCRDELREHVTSRITALCSLLESSDVDAIVGAAQSIATRIRMDKVIFICGNGGSASTALHFANDLAKLASASIGARVSAVTLGANLALLTAYANDLAYEQVFAAELEALGKEGDLLVAISCSGSSRNILRVLHAARVLGIGTLLITGDRSAPAVPLADTVILSGDAEITLQEDFHSSLCHTLAHLVPLVVPPLIEPIAPAGSQSRYE